MSANRILAATLSLALLIWGVAGCETSTIEPGEDQAGQDESAAEFDDQDGFDVALAELVERWHQSLAAGDSSDRERTLITLRIRWEPEVLSAVVGAVFDAEEGVRVAAGRALSANRSPRVAGELVAAMRDRSAECSIEAYQALAAVGRSARVAALDVLVEHSLDPGVASEQRSWAIGALASLGEPAAVPVLAGLSRDPDASVAGSADRAVARLTFRSDVESWSDWWLDHGDLERSDWAISRVDGLELARLAQGDDVRRLSSGARLRDPVRAAARGDILAAIEFLDAPLGAQVLLAAARGATLAAGRLAAVSLVPETLDLDVGREPLITLLLECSADESVEVRLAAMRAANRGSIHEGMSACIEALSDPEEAVRYEAVTALRSFSGQHHHYDPAAPPDSAKRKFAQEIWRSWWESYEERHGREE